MQPQEIRIGNFVNFKNREDIDYCEVTSLDTGGYIHILRNFKDGDGDDQPENIEDITAILLTEEWLERLGLKLSSKTDLWTINDFGIHFDFTVISTNSNEDLPKRDLMDIKEIKYVHELQNLYYALTGKELVLNNGVVN